MFELALVDHLRLTFGHVVYEHRLHAHKARASARWSRLLRAGEAILMATVAYLAVGTALGKGRGYAIACAIVAGAALVTLLLHLTFNSDARAEAHGESAGRLWHMRERYQALLADLADGAVTPEIARRRRDDLGEELRVIYESAPPTNPYPHEDTARATITADEAALSDAEIDRFLPKSLHKPAVSGNT
ncbi:MAG TPA: SLATT domain-containing protein [Vicinamibacterales bacterium]|jgi:hypothetical protein|nr:SLATT domain-containing protein [Vicinamibacterales bacterium]